MMLSSLRGTILAPAVSTSLISHDNFVSLDIFLSAPVVRPSNIFRIYGLELRKYEPSDDGSRSGIGFGGRFGVWEKHIKTFLFFSFHVHTSLNFIGGPEFEMRSGSTIIPHQVSIEFETLHVYSQSARSSRMCMDANLFQFEFGEEKKTSARKQKWKGFDRLAAHASSQLDRLRLPDGNSLLEKEEIREEGYILIERSH
ncbi:hypothetical protein B0H17DRAFT_1135694 [Mycena rosella]|uniref:Uncharacterized protein n=1 Tax=Mycena rosella TaxID=1033263 RepID=A0AAD7DD66_MYCRO|nr:hypothetical protein B0H17DRAFT_1135694 [Mycena rosella]